MILEVAKKKNRESFIFLKWISEMSYEEQRSLMIEKMRIRYDAKKIFLQSEFYGEIRLSFRSKAFSMESFKVKGGPYKTSRNVPSDRMYLLDSERYSSPKGRDGELFLSIYVFNDLYMPIREFSEAVDMYIKERGGRNLCHLLPEVMDMLITGQSPLHGKDIRFHCVVPALSPDQEKPQRVIEYKKGPDMFQYIDEHWGEYLITLGTRFAILTDKYIEPVTVSEE